MAQIPVWVDNGGYGAYHEAVISQNPRRFVGDQLSISGDEIWVFAKNVYGARSKLGFESTLDQVVIQNHSSKWSYRPPPY